MQAFRREPLTPLRLAHRYWCMSQIPTSSQLEWVEKMFAHAELYTTFASLQTAHISTSLFTEAVRTVSFSAYFPSRVVTSPLGAKVVPPTRYSANDV